MGDGETKLDAPNAALINQQQDSQNETIPLSDLATATLDNSGSPPAIKMKDIAKPTNHDVLCGRGGGTNNHVGNNHWRTLVSFNKRLYISLPKRQKMKVAQSIVRAVRSQIPPGRFLQKDSETGLWYDIGDQKAQDKTSQALREGAPDLRSDMEKEGVSKPDNAAEQNTTNMPGYPIMPNMPNMPFPVVPMGMPGVMPHGMPFTPMPFAPMPPQMFPFMPMPGGPMVTGHNNPMFGGQLVPGGMMFPSQDQNMPGIASKNPDESKAGSVPDKSKKTNSIANTDPKRSQSVPDISLSNNQRKKDSKGKNSKNTEKGIVDLTKSSKSEQDSQTQNSYAIKDDKPNISMLKMPEWTGDRPHLHQSFTALPDAPLLPPFISQKTDPANMTNPTDKQMAQTTNAFMPPPPRRSPSLTNPKSVQSDGNLIGTNNTTDYNTLISRQMAMLNGQHDSNDPNNFSAQYQEFMRQQFFPRNTNPDKRNQQSLIDDSDDEDNDQYNNEANTFKPWDNFKEMIETTKGHKTDSIELMSQNKTSTNATSLNRDQSHGLMSTTSVFTSMSDVISVDDVSLGSLSLNNKQTGPTSLSRGNSRTGWGIEATSLMRGESNMSEMTLMRGISDFGYQNNMNHFASHTMSQEQQDQTEKNQNSTQPQYIQSKGDDLIGNIDSKSNQNNHTPFFNSHDMVQNFRQTGDQIINENSHTPHNSIRGENNFDKAYLEAMQNYSNAIIQQNPNAYAGNNAQFFNMGAYDTFQTQNQQDNSGNHDHNFNMR